MHRLTASAVPACSQVHALAVTGTHNDRSGRLADDLHESGLVGMTDEYDRATAVFAAIFGLAPALFQRSSTIWTIRHLQVLTLEKKQ